jgi:ribosome-binding protein aMBF1 (putative translation factor)
MAVICDLCGTKRNVKRAFITFWNGNILDMCRKCAHSFVLENKLKKKEWLDNDG